jgi:hypothetical protein
VRVEFGLHYYATGAVETPLNAPLLYKATCLASSSKVEENRQTSELHCSLPNPSTLLFLFVDHTLLIFQL